MYGRASGLRCLGRIMCPQFSSDCANEQEQKVLPHIPNGFTLPCMHVHAYGPLQLLLCEQCPLSQGNAAWCFAANHLHLLQNFAFTASSIVFSAA